MLVEKQEPLTGNDRFEGFSIDLTKALAKLLHFNYTFKLVDDGKVGRGDNYREKISSKLHKRNATRTSFGGRTTKKGRVNSRAPYQNLPFLSQEKNG